MLLVDATGKPSSVLKREGWTDEEIARVCACAGAKRYLESEAVNKK